MGDCLLQRSHFNCRQGRLESLVTALQAGAINGLLQRITGQNAECVRDSRILRRLADAARDFICDHIVMRRVAAKKAAETDDRIEFLRKRQLASRRGNFEATRHANNPDVLAANSRLMQSLQSSCEEPLRNESIESAHHDSKAPSRTSQLSLQFISPLWRRRIREDR